MLGLPKKSEKSVSPVVRDTGRKVVNRRQSPHCVLVPTMIGSHMILVPRPEHGGGVDWPTSIPALE
jgi:hypothetical protein